MFKHFLHRLVAVITVLACCSSMWAREAIFNFADTHALTAMGITIPTSSKKTNLTSPFAVDGITLTPSTGTIPQVTYYQSKYNLYMFTNTAITLTAPNDSKITRIQFDNYHPDFRAKASSGTITDLEWTGNTNSVTFTATGSNTIYTITVTYSENISITSVTGLGELRICTPGSVVQLSIPDNYNCRVTSVSEDGSEVYLRDNTGAVCFDNVDANPSFKFNQHVAGWITGKYVNLNGMPKLVAGDYTNTTQLVIARAVTEGDVTPICIDAATYDNHVANWVTVKNLHINNGQASVGGTSLVINNSYSLDADSYYHTPHDGAIVDITGLAIPTASGRTLVPIYENGNRPLTYVVSENAHFVAPPSNVANATVRLERHLVGGEWQTLALPFDGTIHDCDIVSPSSLTNGVLTFTHTSAMQAGKPCIVRPNHNVNELTFTDVTLSNSTTSTATGMVGVYNPASNAGRQAMALVSKNGVPTLLMAHVEQLPTTHAHFASVKRLLIDGAYISQYGDVDLDGEVDVADINCIINTMMGSGSTSWLTDVNGDNVTDVADINCEVNTVTGVSIATDGQEWRTNPNNHK